MLAAKAALYEALREERLSNSGFAAAMGIQESEVRRMLDRRHATKIGRLEEALARFKKRLVVTVGSRLSIDQCWQDLRQCSVSSVH